MRPTSPRAPPVPARARAHPGLLCELRAATALVTGTPIKNDALERRGGTDGEIRSAAYLIALRARAPAPRARAPAPRARAPIITTRRASLPRSVTRSSARTMPSLRSRRIVRAETLNLTTARCCRQR
jgi:hypothetical protein